MILLIKCYKCLKAVKLITNRIVTHIYKLIPLMYISLIFAINFKVPKYYHFSTFNSINFKTLKTDLDLEIDFTTV